MKKIDTVLFDFDGTLMDTNDVIINSWQYAFDKIAGRSEDESVLLKTFGEPLELTMKNFFGGTDEDVARNIDIYRSYQHNHFKEDIQLFDGVTELLAKLSQMGCKLALVTSRLAFTTHQGIEKFGLDKYLDTVVTANDTTVHKPDPEPINIALRKLDSAPERTIMVGDTWMDLKCAQNAGAKSVLVGWSRALPASETSAPGFGDGDGRCKPDYIINTADEMIELLEKLNQ